MTGTRTDAFLDGRLTILQPVAGYRAGADPVFLAAAVPAKPGERVLELGCGVGTAFLCLANRVSELTIHAVEKTEAYAALAQTNAQAAGVEAWVHKGDLAALPTDLKSETFDHVFFNPPFFDRGAGSRSPDIEREGARGAEETVNFWIDVGLKRLRPGGTLTLIHRITALPSTLSALETRAGGTTILPLQPRVARDAKLFLLNTIKGSKSDFTLMHPLVLHKGEKHEKDGESYTDAARSVLRDGAALVLNN